MGDPMFLIVWIGSALLGGAIIWLKQGFYLADVQPIAFLMCGPLTLLLALIAPKSWLTSREKAEGK